MSYFVLVFKYLIVRKIKKVNHIKIICSIIKYILLDINLHFIHINIIKTRLTLAASIPFKHINLLSSVSCPKWVVQHLVFYFWGRGFFFISWHHNRLNISDISKLQIGSKRFCILKLWNRLMICFKVLAFFFTGVLASNTAVIILLQVYTLSVTKRAMKYI